MCAQETQKTEENERGVDLNINIYYGGRGIIDDPTIYVINNLLLTTETDTIVDDLKI